MRFHSRTTSEPEINLIAFIDVLLVIVIFLMLSTTWSRMTEINLTLPSANVQKETPRTQLVVLSITFLDKLKIDDPVGAISVHGTCGILGLLLVPLTNSDATFMGQIIGGLTIFVWVFVTSLIVWGVLKMVMGIRVSEEDEYKGVDLAECGQEAYPEFVTK